MSPVLDAELWCESMRQPLGPRWKTLVDSIGPSGVSPETIERCAEAGADTFVAGSAVYSAADPDAMVIALREQAIAACAH